jgi:hypothetical protein
MGFLVTDDGTLRRRLGRRGCSQGRLSLGEDRKLVSSGEKEGPRERMHGLACSRRARTHGAKFGICGSLGGRMGNWDGNKATAHDWLRFVMKGERQRRTLPSEVVAGAHTQLPAPHTQLGHSATVPVGMERQAGRAKWVGGTLEMEGSMEGAFHRGKRGRCGCGPPLLVAGASQSARPVWGLLRERERCNLRQSWGEPSLVHGPSPGLLAVFSKTRRTRYCRPKTLDSPMPRRSRSTSWWENAGHARCRHSAGLTTNPGFNKNPRRQDAAPHNTCNRGVARTPVFPAAEPSTCERPKMRTIKDGPGTQRHRPGRVGV